MSKETLASEAKKFRQKRRISETIKPLTTRRYLAGQALSGILSSNRGVLIMSEVKREAYAWADYMLEED